MKGARSVAKAATLGNLLHGWDNAAIAGALLYLKIEFHLEENPFLEGVVVAAGIIGAVASTTAAGPAADSLGRRYMLRVAGILFTISGSIMIWSPTIYVLIFGRFLAGVSIGVASAIIPIFISECAPAEIRGELATLPQLMGSTGMLSAYSMSFGLSLMADPSWRLILGVLIIPAAMYVGLCLFYLPESPRWLVSKGRILEATVVLRGLQNQEDVLAELALLVEGLGDEVDTSTEKWLVKSAVTDPVDCTDKDCERRKVLVRDEEAGLAGNTSTSDNHEEDSGIEGESAKFLATPLLQKPTTSKTNLLPRGGEAFQAAALIDPSVQVNKDLGFYDEVGPATVHPSEAATKGATWSDLMDAGVERALVVGVGLVFLQQFSGINAVLYFTPQILKQSGGNVMAASGLNPDSTSILASAFISLMMLPCIFLAMWLMDRAGRRQLLLMTLPLLGSALVVLALLNSLVSAGIIQAVGSFLGVTVFMCTFVMGFGLIPNILVSEMFSTKVRGIAMSITANTAWLCNVIVLYGFPVANAHFGLAWSFVFFAVMSAIAWVFVFLKVPETKGLPLEVIAKFFSSGEAVRLSQEVASGDPEEPRKGVLYNPRDTLDPYDSRE